MQKSLDPCIISRESFNQIYYYWCFCVYIFFFLFGLHWNFLLNLYRSLTSLTHSVEPYFSNLEVLSVTSPASSSFVPACAFTLPKSNQYDYKIRTPLNYILCCNISFSTQLLLYLGYPGTHTSSEISFT